MAEVTGIIEEIVFRNEDNGFTVLELREEREGSLTTVVGNLPFAVEGERVRVTGEWTVHPDYGQQLKAENFQSVPLPAWMGLKNISPPGLSRG